MDGQHEQRYLRLGNDERHWYLAYVWEGMLVKQPVVSVSSCLLCHHIFLKARVSKHVCCLACWMWWSRHCDLDGMMGGSTTHLLLKHVFCDNRICVCIRLLASIGFCLLPVNCARVMGLSCTYGIDRKERHGACLRSWGRFGCWLLWACLLEEDHGS